MPRRHVCTNQRNVSYPIRTKRVFCKPTYKKYMVRCGDQWCEGVRLVYEKYHKDIVSNNNHSHVDYTCCPGWTQVNFRSHGCNKPVCEKPCANGGRCVKPNVCSCPPGFSGTYCESRVSMYAPPGCTCSCPDGICSCCPPEYIYVANPSCFASFSKNPPKSESPLHPSQSPQSELDRQWSKHNGLQDEEEEKRKRLRRARQCAQPCQNGGTCVPPTGCTCLPGFVGKQCEKDIDECKEKPCDQICYNTPGSYKCECKENFLLQKDGQTCRKEQEEETTFEAKDLDQQLRLDKLDKRLHKLEKIMTERSKNEVTKTDLNNIYGRIDRMSTDIGTITNKLHRLTDYDPEITTNKRDQSNHQPPPSPPPEPERDLHPHRPRPCPDSCPKMSEKTDKNALTSGQILNKNSALSDHHSERAIKKHSYEHVSSYSWSGTKNQPVLEKNASKSFGNGSSSFVKQQEVSPEKSNTYSGAVRFDTEGEEMFDSTDLDKEFTTVHHEYDPSRSPPASEYTDLVDVNNPDPECRPCSQMKPSEKENKNLPSREQIYTDELPEPKPQNGSFRCHPCDKPQPKSKEENRRLSATEGMTSGDLSPTLKPKSTHSDLKIPKNVVHKKCYPCSKEQSEKNGNKDKSTTKKKYRVEELETKARERRYRRRPGSDSSDEDIDKVLSEHRVHKNTSSSSLLEVTKKYSEHRSTQKNLVSAKEIEVKRNLNKNLRSRGLRSSLRIQKNTIECGTKKHLLFSCELDTENEDDGETCTPCPNFKKLEKPSVQSSSLVSESTKSPNRYDIGEELNREVESPSIVTEIKEFLETEAATACPCDEKEENDCKKKHSFRASFMNKLRLEKNSKKSSGSSIKIQNCKNCCSKDSPVEVDKEKKECCSKKKSEAVTDDTKSEEGNTSCDENCPRRSRWSLSSLVQTFKNKK